ncbi:hypothetical protein AVT69_gp200 [Pseudomonas phage PhiPA3]|uniref:Uncharacterized protein 202 n=1 Tax=Pseudomonas phage PhiPA3 TaxID=998086 RepID=F8SJ45_BPPA3|nr:hypothetical protein AVT69_gp200 [Pseudomonas phage PhiPA3]AEH03625.1 hypothetical protein [Pseudomonas phage PhiPA3]
MPTLASASFTGIPTDPVKTVDAYKDVVDTTLQNTLQPKISAFEIGMDDLLAKTTKVVKGIGSSLLGSGGIDLNQAKDRIVDALKGSRSSIVYLGEALERSINEELTGTDTGTGYVRKATDMLDGVKAIMQNKEYYFENGNFQGVNGIMGFLGDLTNNSILRAVDLGANAAILKGVLSQVSAWGIPDLVDTTFGASWNDQYKRYDYQYDDNFRFTVAKRTSKDLSPGTDLLTIDRIMVHGGDMALVAENPDFPIQLLSSYVFPAGTVPGGPFPVMIPDPANPSGPMIPDPEGTQTVPNYANELALLLEIMDRLKPDWFYYLRRVFIDRNGDGDYYRDDKVWNLRVIAQASQDATTLLLTSDEHRDAVLTAPFYKVESATAELKAMYPYFAE